MIIAPTGVAAIGRAIDNKVNCTGGAREGGLGHRPYGVAAKRRGNTFRYPFFGVRKVFAAAAVFAGG